MLLGSEGCTRGGAPKGTAPGGKGDCWSQELLGKSYQERGFVCDSVDCYLRACTCMRGQSHFKVPTSHLATPHGCWYLRRWWGGSHLAKGNSQEKKSGCEPVTKLAAAGKRADKLRGGDQGGHQAHPPHTAGRSRD